MDPVDNTYAALQQQVQSLSDAIDALNYQSWKKSGPGNGISGSFINSVNFVTGVSGWQLTPDGNLEANNGNFRGDITGATGTFSGAVTGGSLNIPDTVTANSFHTDSSGNSWWGATTYGAGVAKISNAGNAIFTSVTASGYVAAAQGTFGGNGSDGALAISSGTTTISAASAGSIVKNYASISITGTGALAFSTPNSSGTFILLRSQGNVTLTSSATPMIDASGMGAAGGVGAACTNGAGWLNGSSGNGGVARHFIHYTTGGGRAGVQSGPTPGPAGAAPALALGTSIESTLMQRYLEVQVGAGGASGVGINIGTGTVTTGAGGTGGGALIIECLGAWNFTTASGISVAGKDGGNVSSGGSGAYAAVDGAAGSGGFFIALYKTLTANSGTVTVSGGSGTRKVHFVGGVASDTPGAGSGGSPISAGVAGINSNVDGTVVSGAGVSGYSFIGQNYIYA